MQLSCVYTAIFILVNLKYFIECGGKRQTVCLKELKVFSVQKTTSNASSDTRPSICSNNSGCCNKTIEDEMKTQITKILMNLIRGRNEGERRQFKDVHDDLEGIFQSVLKQTSESIIDYLQSQVKGNMAQDAKPHIRTLFDEVQTSVASKDLHVQNSTIKFFRNFYPVVYRYTVVKKILPGEYSDCLKNKLSVIMPFKDVPQKMTIFLIKKLLPVQQFLRSLQTIGNVLDVLDNVELSAECKFSLVKMSYCSLCDGLSNVKPCPQYCLNVVSSCLDPYTEIEYKWSSFIRHLDNFRDLLAKSLDASSMFSRLQQLLSESISHASHSEVAKRVSTHCGNMTDYMRNKIISLRKQQSDSARDLGNSDLYLTTDVHNTYENLPTASDIRKKLIFLQNNLSNIKDYMKKFHINLCLVDNLASSDEKSNCWLGTSLARTSVSVIKNATALKPDNSKTILDDVLALLNKAISDIRRVKSRPWKMDHGSGDGSGSGEEGPDTEHSGSGLSVVTFSGGCNDDEDCESDSSGATDIAKITDQPVSTINEERTTEIIIPLATGSGTITMNHLRTIVAGLLLVLLFLG